MDFKCFDCDLIFDSGGKKVDYIDPIYGPCCKIEAICPVCGSACTEYRKPKQSKGSSEMDNSCPSYHSGACSCCH